MSNLPEISMILAAEECEDHEFDKLHKFSPTDEKTIRKLVSHGPVLLQGGRGSGKSALMIEASRRAYPFKKESNVLGFYISLRYVPLLRSEGDEYEKLFCTWVSSKIKEKTESFFSNANNIRDLKEDLTELSLRSQKRLVLFFDDVAHLGRETSLGTFFDIFRTLSSNLISCKASIYPGVTEFGTRFDIYNDAVVVDVIRNPEQSDFAQQFSDILTTRYPPFPSYLSNQISLEAFASFSAIAVLGNVRAFVFLCNHLIESLDSENKSIGYSAITRSLLYLASDYYWPLLEEVRPKLGKYTPAVEPALQIAELVFEECGKASATSAVIHKKIVAKYSKPFEILEYVGFLTKREASRAMKSGGRGGRYSLNLCNLLEKTQGSRVTSALFEDWSKNSYKPFEFHEKNENINSVIAPLPDNTKDAVLLKRNIDCLKKSKVYPYGITEQKIEKLKEFGITTLEDLSNAKDEDLDRIEGIGKGSISRFRHVLAQALWM